MTDGTIGKGIGQRWFASCGHCLSLKYYSKRDKKRWTPKDRARFALRLHLERKHKITSPEIGESK